VNALNLEARGKFFKTVFEALDFFKHMIMAAAHTVSFLSALVA